MVPRSRNVWNARWIRPGVSSVGHRIPPPARRRKASCFHRTPASRLVHVQLRVHPQHGIDNAPGFLNVVLARKECVVSSERIAQHAHVAVALGCARMAACEKLHGLSLSALLAYAVVRYRARAGENTEPPQVFGSVQIELAWTIIPVLIVITLFLGTAIAGLGFGPGFLGAYRATATVPRVTPDQRDVLLSHEILTTSVEVNA